jgi:hypothetical protein
MTGMQRSEVKRLQVFSRLFYPLRFRGEEMEPPGYISNPPLTADFPGIFGNITYPCV